MKLTEIIAVLCEEIEHRGNLDVSRWGIRRNLEDEFGGMDTIDYTLSSGQCGAGFPNIIKRLTTPFATVSDEDVRTKGACPECGSHLAIVPEVLLMCNPPKHKIQCVNPNCEYETSAYLQEDQKMKWQHPDGTWHENPPILPIVPSNPNL